VVRLLDDNPTTEDRLGFATTADTIVETIKNASRRPLTVGVFGGWGTGKTSLMQMAEARLKGDQIKTVWFNAWKYSGKEVIWNALIQTILLAMKNDPDVVSQSKREKFKQRVIAVSQGLAMYAAKVGTRFIPGGIIREEDVDELWKALSSSVEDGSPFEFINRFESEFERLVDEYVGDSYLVVFIDDLDRCLPENAIEVMEALKLYLDKANSVFVMGVEPSIIEAAISLRYGTNSGLSASKYLEKIVQVPIAVPRVRTQSGLELISSVGGAALSTRPREFVRLIRSGLDRNPRRIKRFVNTYGVTLSAVPEPSVDAQLTLAKVLVIQMRFPDFYRELTRDPGLIERVQDVSDEGIWKNADAGHLFNDFELRRFLHRTKGFPASASGVRRWIRVTESSEEPEDEIPEPD
jgi:KAP family P-loop domain